MYKIDSNFNINKISPNLSITDIDNNKKYNKIFIITEKRINDLFSKHKIFDLGFHQITINDSKDIKTLHSVKLIINDLMNANATRDSLLIGLGGGSISDIVGFIASIYMRGIDHVFMPTTLLGMVDASIGGKTGVDFLGVKNLVGTFKQPEGIIIDFHFLDSLDSNYIIDGFSEIIKYGLIFDKVFFDKVFKNFNSLINKNDFKEIIIQACNYKIKTVLKDQFDQNQRMILNFGHTFAHGFEAAKNFTNKLNHGEAVLLGMINAAQLSFDKKLLKKKRFGINKKTLC